VRFWDSSAVVPLLVAEPARERLLRTLETDNGLLVWWGTPVECVSAIARRERSGDLGIAAASAALDRLRALEQSWVEVSPSTALRRTALRLLRTHPLRATDALQLAAALVAAEQDAASLGFVCLDERLASAAQREGFDVLS
jgi:predicted nucleic acid-binding protein